MRRRRRRYRVRAFLDCSALECANDMCLYVPRESCPQAYPLGPPNLLCNLQVLDVEDNNSVVGVVCTINQGFEPGDGFDGPAQIETLYVVGFARSIALKV